MSLEYLHKTFDWREPAIAELYDELPLWSSYFGKILLDKIPLRHNMTVLDAGFGTGFPLIEIAQRLRSSSLVYGIDQWDAAFNRAQRKIETFRINNINLFKGSASDMPFENNFFDFMTANLVLNNLEEQDKAINEFYRVIKPGGGLFMTSNLTGHMQEFYEVFADTLTELNMESCKEELNKNIEHRLSIELISNKLKNAGFKNLHIEQDKFYMRFADGSALLNHSFVIIGFIDGWKNIIPDNEKEKFFTKLEENLNIYSNEKGELKLTIPMLYIQAVK